MGVLSAADCQTFTDGIVARVKKDLAGRDAELAGGTALSLADLIRSGADPDVIAALLPSALKVDRQSLPEFYYANVLSIFARSAYSGLPYRDLAMALDAQVKSADGGGYASFDAYLLDKGATIHPIYAELHRSVTAENAFDESGDVTRVFAPNYQTRVPDRVYTGADGALVDDTTDAGSATAADVALFGTNGHTLYIGSRYKFSQVVVGLSTLANVTITPTFQYWNGNAWVTLTLTDNATGFTKNDTLAFTAPADWERTYKDAGGTVFPNEYIPLYYIRVVRGAVTVGTPPVGTCIRIVPDPVLITGSTSHFGLDQPPLAIVRLTGATALTVVPVASIAYGRWKEPGVRARALTPMAFSPVLTLAYKNQADAAASQAQSAWTTPAALDTVAITLAGGDTGVRSVPALGHAVSAAGQGIVEIYAAESRTPAL